MFITSTLKARKTYRMQRMEAECCIFMLFLRLRMLSDDWYTWMLQGAEMFVGGGGVKKLHQGQAAGAYK